MVTFQKQIIRNTEDQGLIYLTADSECVVEKLHLECMGLGLGLVQSFPGTPAVAGSGIHPFQACPLSGSSLMDVLQREGFYDGLVGGDALQC